MSDESLRDLARVAGLAPEWTDASGRAMTVPTQTLRIVLAALGMPSDGDRIAESRRALANQEPAPLLVVRPGDRISLGSARRALLLLEDGAEMECAVAAGENGETFVTMPDRTGYHAIETDRGLRRVAVTPSRCFSLPQRRRLALAVQLYSLRGGHTRGFGDLAALGTFAQSAASQGVDAVAISPIHALFLAAPENFGPYSPSSRFFLNPLYADTGVPGGGDPADSLVYWPNAAREKIAALRAAFARFRQAPAPAAFTAFCAEQGEALVRHARFEALHAHLQCADWHAWPAAYRDPASPEVNDFSRLHKDDVDFHIFLQWLTAAGLEAAQRRACDAGMEIGLIADLAVGMDSRGSHAWAAPDDLLSGLSIGAPPDIFNPQGQNWGLTALSPTALRRSGYHAFISTLRAVMRHCGGVRIDHAMGLCRLWLVPEGADAAEGVYLHYPMRELLGLIALESRRHSAIVIGEDLGTVPEGFRQAARETGLLGMEVLWFQRDHHGYFAPEHWSRDAAALTTTHDLPTVAGWWSGHDIDWLERLGRRSSQTDPAAERRARAHDRELLWSAMAHAGSVTGAPPAPQDSASVVEGTLDFVGRSACELALVPIEDVLALSEQPNIPGTTTEHPNWRRRLPPGEALATPEARANLARLRRARDA
jgi:4-alpha-glucanotransferase